MTEKSEEQIAKEKEAIDRMRGAQAAMKAALDRIADLERALVAARDDLTRCKAYVGPSTYVWTNNDRITVPEQIDRYAAEATKALGS